LAPALEGLPLEGLVQAFGVPGPARGGVFAPVQQVAELAAALLARLPEQGIVTHGQARAACAVATATSAGGPP
jgi:hypothetical protein